MNNQYVGSTPLPHTDKASQEANIDLPVPVWTMPRRSPNSMPLKFFFNFRRRSECREHGAIEPAGRHPR